MAKPRKRKETDKQFLSRLDRTLHRTVKDGGPTRDEILRGIRLKTAQP